MQKPSESSAFFVGTNGRAGRASFFYDYRDLGRGGAWPPDIEKKVDEHACHRDIVPDGKGEFSPAFMGFEITFDGKKEGAGDQICDRDSEDDVRNQHCIIEGPNRGAFSAKRGVDALHQDFMRHVTHQKNSRNKSCGKHAGAVRFTFALFDENKAERNQHGGGGIKRRI